MGSGVRLVEVLVLQVVGRVRVSLVMLGVSRSSVLVLMGRREEKEEI